MSKFVRERGITVADDLLFHIFVRDKTQTDGRGKTALIFSDFTVRYVRPGEVISGVITPQDITTLGTYQAPTANTNIRIKELDATDMPGIYEVHVHQDWYALKRSIVIFFNASASDGEVTPVEVELQSLVLDGSKALRWKTALESMLQIQVDETAFIATQTEFESDTADLSSEPDAYKDARLVWEKQTVGGALFHQRAKITASSLVAGRIHFTVTGNSMAPADDDFALLV